MAAIRLFWRPGSADQSEAGARRLARGQNHFPFQQPRTTETIDFLTRPSDVQLIDHLICVRVTLSVKRQIATSL